MIKINKMLLVAMFYSISLCSLSADIGILCDDNVLIIDSVLDEDETCEAELSIIINGELADPEPISSLFGPNSGSLSFEIDSEDVIEVEVIAECSAPSGNSSFTVSRMIEPGECTDDDSQDPGESPEPEPDPNQDSQGNNSRGGGALTWLILLLTACLPLRFFNRKNMMDIT